MKLLGAWCAALLLIASASNVFAVGEMVSVSIIDAPRPQPRWGFAPGASSIAPGTWVTWSNDGQDAHTVTALDGSFDSGNLDPSQGFSWYFSEPGTFQYVCVLHPWMTGTIVVGGDEAQPAPDDSSGSGSLP